MSSFTDGIKQSMSTTIGKIAGCFGCLILAIIVIGVLAALGQAGKGTSQPAKPDNSSSSTTTTSTPTIAKQPITLLDLTGTGTKTTEKFTAASDWDLNWSYDCSNFGYNGHFAVEVYNGDGSMSFENAAVNQLGNKDTGVEHYHKGGTYYLTVNSECSWTLNAKG